MTLEDRWSDPLGNKESQEAKHRRAERRSVDCDTLNELTNNLVSLLQFAGLLMVNRHLAASNQSLGATGLRKLKKRLNSKECRLSPQHSRIFVQH